MNSPDKYFYLAQRNWINDHSPLKIAVKSRQIGFSYQQLAKSRRGAELARICGARQEAQANSSPWRSKKGLAFGNTDVAARPALQESVGATI